MRNISNIFVYYCDDTQAFYSLSYILRVVTACGKRVSIELTDNRIIT